MSKLYKYDGAEFPLDSAGLTESIKSAFVSCFHNVAWLTEEGKTAYDNLVQLLGVDDTEVVSNINTLTKGTGYWTTNDEYLQWESNTNASANISSVRLRAGDVFSIGDYTTYKYKVGTGNAESSNNGEAWTTDQYLTADYIVPASMIENIKVIIIKRIDDADLTDTDLTYLNSHVSVSR